MGIIAKQEERAAIAAYVEKRLMAGYARSRLAVECDIPSEHLDRLIRLDFNEGVYDNYERYAREDYPYYRKVDKYLQALETWMLADEQTQAVASFAATPTCRAIHMVINNARAGHSLSAIIGGVGIGKSIAAKAYVAAHPRTQQAPGFVYVKFDSGSSSAAAALHAILYALIGEHRGRRADGLIHDIGREMRPGDGLILDECNYLVKALDAIRDLWDGYQIPIIVMGNPDFNKMVAGKKPSFTAFASRVLRHEFPCTQEEDVDAWLEWAGLSGAELRRVACAIACRPGEHGGLRSLASLVNQFRTMRAGEPLTAANLRSIAEAYGRGIRKGEKL